MRLAVSLLFLSAALIVPLPSDAKVIEKACNGSDRVASASLCNCIQSVADQILTRSDQRLAARFFKDPQMAQDTRQSDNSSKEAFWKRYKAFGETAAAVCSS